MQTSRKNKSYVSFKVRRGGELGMECAGGNNMITGNKRIFAISKNQMLPHQTLSLMLLGDDNYKSYIAVIGNNIMGEEKPTPQEAYESAWEKIVLQE
jgi:hypothetical protein